MGKITLLILSLLFGKDLFSQIVTRTDLFDDSLVKKNFFILINTADTTKRIVLNSTFNDDLSIVFKNDTLSNGEIVNETFRATFQNIIPEDTSAELRIIASTHTKTDKEGFMFTTSNSYSYEGNYKTPNKKINLQSIDYIETSSKVRSIFQGGSITLTTASMFTALILAPLVSINYKNFSFNSKRYYTLAGVGLIGIGLGIPTIIFSLEKTYQITSNKKLSNKKYWYLDRKPKPTI